MNLLGGGRTKKFMQSKEKSSGSFVEQKNM
jgi:hypothetical protein